MSDVLIRKAFEKRLALMMPVLATAYENVAYTPVNGTPYQRPVLLPAQPDNATLGDAYHRLVGLFQVGLYYPLGNGPNAAQARAEAIRTQFKRGTSMTESSQTVLVIRTPTISPAQVIDDRYFVAVSIYYQSEIFS